MASGILNQPTDFPPELAFQSDHVTVLLCEPHRCATCGASHFYFINREGRTRCFNCDFSAVTKAGLIDRDSIRQDYERATDYRYLPLGKAARRIGVCRKTLRRWLQAELGLMFAPMGRGRQPLVRLADLEEVVRRRTGQVTAEVSK